MDILKRKEIADSLFQEEVTERVSELSAEKILEVAAREPEPPKCGIFDFPEGLQPIPLPMTNIPNKSDALPKADIVIVTWTLDEQDGLADIFTHPYVRPGRRKNYSWYPYDRHFNEKYRNQIRQGAPSTGSCKNPKNQLGNYFLAKVGTKTILLFKSELHLNQDGIYLNEDRTPVKCQDRYIDETGYSTLPVKELFKQIAEETEAEHIITVGTCGASMLDHNMGDVVVTRGASFLLSSEFAKEKFNNSFKRERGTGVISLDKPLHVYKSDWNYSTKYFQEAENMFNRHKDKIEYFPIQAPITQYVDKGGFQKPQSLQTKIHSDLTNMDEFFPILTTDFFEYGTSTNKLNEIGCGCEMGDAVLGLACEELGNKAPKWLVVRNLSDPVMNGNMIDPIRDAWAVYFYRKNGYYTSVNSAITTWAIIAGEL